MNDDRGIVLTGGFETSVDTRRRDAVDSRDGVTWDEEELVVRDKIQGATPQRKHEAPLLVVEPSHSKLKIANKIAEAT